MKLKVGILSDYKGDFGHFIKILSPNNDSKIKITQLDLNKDGNMVNGNMTLVFYGQIGSEAKT